MGHSSQLSKCWVNVTRKTSSRDAVFKNAKLSLRAALLVKTWKRRLRLPYPTNRPPTATIGSLLLLRRRFGGGPVAGDRLVGMNCHFGTAPPKPIIFLILQIRPIRHISLSRYLARNGIHERQIHRDAPAAAIYQSQMLQREMF